uniref:TIL domain-containing protein n=1 Tax=Plectus sambesii TaxID=2011161 RepID=A0A914UHI6_9BILA
MLRAALFVLVFVTLTVCFSHAYGGHKWRKMLEDRDNVDETKLSSHKMTCWKNEEYVDCGPEPKCEISCYNRFNPPKCALHHRALCNFPRCLCKNGFVRDDQRNCIPSQECPKYRKHKAILFGKSSL